MAIGVPEVLIIFLVSTVFWVWVLIDCVTKETESNERLIWALIIVLTNVIGALIYLFVRRPQRIKTVGR
ncbi:MAG: PLD nuclease N-terminal domain-containing protein [Chloroflexota bacterium]